MTNNDDDKRRRASAAPNIPPTIIASAARQTLEASRHMSAEGASPRGPESAQTATDVDEQSKALRHEAVNLRHVEAELQAARERIAAAVKSGNSADFVSAVFVDDRFLPVEGALVDYKRDAPADRTAECKLLKHVQAFHNTYGGFLVIGAAEIERDHLIQPVHATFTGIATKKLRDLCREFFSASVEVDASVHDLCLADGSKRQVQVIYVPRRSAGEPVTFRREASKDTSGKSVFQRDQTFIRDADNSVPATALHHWRLLFGDRICPYERTTLDVKPVEPLWNNLPDRSLICQELIGRKEVLARLFSWLADDFTCVKVIAGEGGLGKTSIAYQFASEVARSRLASVEQVIWLTAKRYQFRALQNDYEELATPHFSTCEELFQQLASAMGAIPDDYKDITDQEYPRFLRRLANTLRVLVVIDDIDSLDVDQQKRSIEVCQQLSGTGSRFLFTTRKNATASTSTALEIQGLLFDEYRQLLDTWKERLKVRALSEKEARRFHETTLGSPLYTESLLRLVKGGMHPNEAVAKWKGNLGIEVRNAALKREVLQLGTEARRVLVAAAVLGECSLAELKHITGYSDTTLMDSTYELESLFLVHAPPIARQARFAVSNTTRELVTSLGPELIPGFLSFQEMIISQRYNAKSKTGDLRAVGIAINQAVALLSGGQPEDALRTIDEVNKGFQNKNKDLLFMRARVLLQLPVPRMEDARKAFQQAHEQGQRKPLFFSLWFETESRTESFERAVDVASEALAASVGSRADWLTNRAYARLRSAATSDKRGDGEHSAMQLEEAGKDLSQAAADEPELRWDPLWRESLFGTHDSHWNLATRSADSVPAWLIALDGQVSAIARGDHRLVVYGRLLQALTAINAIFASRSDTRTARELNLTAQLVTRCVEQFKAAPVEHRLNQSFKTAQAAVSGFAAEFARRGRDQGRE